MQKEIHILIADDHPIFRRGLRAVVESDPLLKIVAEADEGKSALARILELQPDVAVLDIDMPLPDGLAVARQLREQRLPVAIIFLTMHKDEAMLNAALDAGVKGFIVKDSAANEIVGCIKAVAGGAELLQSGPVRPPAQQAKSRGRARHTITVAQRPDAFGASSPTACSRIEDQ